MNGRARALAAVAAALVAAGYAAAALLAGAGRAAGPVLDASVGPGFTISLTQGGAPVTTLPPGAYTIDVDDMSSLHDFHLQGPGVDKATTIGGSGSQTWDVTFTDGQYSYVCDAHPASMHGAFTVAASTTTTTTSSTTTSSTATTSTTPPPPVTSSTTTAPTTSTATATTTLTTTAPPPTTSTAPPVTTTTGTTTLPPAAAAAVLKSVRVQARGRRAGRVVIVRVALARAGTVRVRLLRRSRPVASTSRRVGTTPAALTLRVPVSAPAGRYSVEVAAGGKRMLGTVTLPR